MTNLTASLRRFATRSLMFIVSDSRDVLGLFVLVLPNPSFVIAGLDPAIHEAFAPRA